MSSSPSSRPAHSLLDHLRTCTLELALAAGATSAWLACNNGVTDVEPPLSASLTPEIGWTVIDDSITVQAVVNYPSGPRPPLAVDWSVSDSSVLDLSVATLDEANVRGLERGDAYVIARIDNEYQDSTRIYVSDMFKVRWRVEGVGDATVSGPTLDSRNYVYTVRTGSSQDTLTAVTATGAIVYSEASCWSDLSGSVLPDGTAYTTRSACVKRHAPDGSVDWTFEACGDSYGGIAVDADGSVACVNADTDSLYRVSAGGALIWRVPLDGLLEWRSAPVIAKNGDVYVGWTSSSPRQYWISRISSDGTLLWTEPSAGEVDWNSPGIDGDRIIFSHDGGYVTVYDTTGAVVWGRDWDSGRTSSPVIDGSGNIYIQSTTGLLSYDADGALRWQADSLRSDGYYVPAPTLRADGSLLLSCRLPISVKVDLCAVDTNDGAVIGRSNLGADMFGSPAVAPDGTIYITVGTDLFALVDSISPLTEGWPTEGGGMGRLRNAR